MLSAYIIYKIQINIFLQTENKQRRIYYGGNNFIIIEEKNTELIYVNLTQLFTKYIQS